MKEEIENQQPTGLHWIWIIPLAIICGAPPCWVLLWCIWKPLIIIPVIAMCACMAEGAGDDQMP